MHFVAQLVALVWSEVSEEHGPAYCIYDLAIKIIGCMVESVAIIQQLLQV